MSELFISGPRGRLEARHAALADHSSPVAVVLHPRPLHGGTMNNKVVLIRSLVEAGCYAVRSSFRVSGAVAESTSVVKERSRTHRRHPQSSTTRIAGLSPGA